MKRHSKFVSGLMGITAAVLAIGASAQAQTAGDTWMNRITLGADVRLRLNQTAIDGRADWNENIRARVAAAGKINDALTGNIRLATSSGANTATTSNATSGDYATKKAIYLDVASLDYKFMDGFNIVGGKQLNPLWSAGKNELVFDVDVVPEGFFAKYAGTMGGFTPFITIGHSQITDNNTATTTLPADAQLFAAQIGAGFDLGMFGGTLAVSDLMFNNLKGQTPNNTAGNSLVNGTYANEYKLMVVDLELAVKLGEMPLAPYMTWAQNSDPSEAKDAMLAGIKFGKVTDVGSWMIDYNYRDVKADAVVGAFTESDAGGSTGLRGHKVSVAYGIWTNTTVGANAFFMNRNVAAGGSVPYERYQLDLAASF